MTKAGIRQNDIPQRSDVLWLDLADVLSSSPWQPAPTLLSLADEVTL
jgi:hypothetical protein